MNDVFYYYSRGVENNLISIPSKILYDAADTYKTIVIEGDNCSKTINGIDYKDFECKESEEFRIARFKIIDKKNVLDPFRLKLYQSYHINYQWFNKLQDYFLSQEFILSLKQINELRASGKSVSTRENQFNYLKNQILQTEIPSENTDMGIWKNLILKCKEIQNEFRTNNKKD